jgi:hypothetical protein
LITPLLTSCEKWNEPNISGDKNLIKNLYENSSDTIAFESNMYFLETYLYRNFMPGAFKNRDLVAFVSLIRADSLLVSENIVITQLYVINDKTVWISTPHNSDDPYIPKYKLQGVSKDGPKWDTDISVDVVAEVSNITNHDKFLLLARHQTIHRAD